MNNKIKFPRVKLKATVTKGELDHKICSSADAYDALKCMFDKNTVSYQEQFIVVFLNQANVVIGYEIVSTGGMTGTVVDPRVIFTHALLAGATGIILAHNHPSGNLTPSGADLNLTAELKAAGDMLDIKVLDHIIYTENNGYYSFVDNDKI